MRQPARPDLWEAWVGDHPGPPGRRAGPALRLEVAPAFPLDARLRAVTVDGRAVEPAVTTLGDVQRAEAAIDATGKGAASGAGDASGGTNETTLVFEYDGGTDAYVPIDPPDAGATSQGLRLLRSRAGADALRLVVEGLGGRSYTVKVRSGRRLTVGSPAPKDVTVTPTGPGRYDVTVVFEGPADSYERRDLALPLE